MSVTTEPSQSLIEVINEVCEERARQDRKWGEQNHPDEWWLPILSEEVGELAQAMLRLKFAGNQHGKSTPREELVQVAAVALAWLECLRRRDAAGRK